MSQDFLIEIETAVAQLPEDLQVAWMRFRMSCTKEWVTINNDTQHEAFFKHPRHSSNIRIVMLPTSPILAAAMDTRHISIPWCRNLASAMKQGIANIIIPIITPPKLHGVRLDLVILDDVEGA